MWEGERKGTVRRQEGWDGHQSPGEGTLLQCKGREVGKEWMQMRVTIRPNGGKMRKGPLAFYTFVTLFTYVSFLLRPLLFPVDCELLKAGPVAALFTAVSSDLVQDRCSKNVCRKNR